MVSPYTFRVIVSVPERSWGVVENELGDKFFIRVANGRRLILRGTELIEVPLKIGEIPPIGTEVLVEGTKPPERDGSYDQAAKWFEKDHAEKMRSSCAKAKRTLSELAAQAQADNEARQAKIRANLDRKRSSGGKKEKNGAKAR